MLPDCSRIGDLIRTFVRLTLGIPMDLPEWCMLEHKPHPRRYTCASRNKRVHNTRPMASFTPTNSASVELLVLIFCLVDSEKMEPRLFDFHVRPVRKRNVGARNAKLLI